ncbi:MAG: HEAT repeat domain-containing protein [Acidimicrobiia bacterium]
MKAELLPWLVVAVALSVLAAVWLFASKFIGHLKRRFELYRRASYVGLLSEIATRVGYPVEMLRSCADDRVFLDTLMDFLGLVQGAERANLLHVARSLGIVERFVADLSSRRRERRVVAARGLAELGDPRTAEALLRSLADRVPEVRIQAADALAQLKDERAVEPLIGLLETETEWNANRIADALVKLGSRAVPALSRHLIMSFVGSETGREPLVARALGAIGDVAAEPALVRALQEGSDEVRIRSAAALHTAGSQASVHPLIRAVTDPVWEVRAQAARALGGLLDPEAIPALKAALGDPEWWVRRNADLALERVPGGTPHVTLDGGDGLARTAAPETVGERTTENVL